MKKLALCLAIGLLISAVPAADSLKTCNVQDECGDLYDCVNNVCQYKELFPITAREVFGTFFILLINALMTAGGVGAGAAYVPYIMLIFNVNLSTAISIGYACVFGGGVGNLLNIAFIRDAKTKRFMINYDCNLIILPALMIGVFIGNIVNRVAAPILVEIILLFVLTYSVQKNFFKIKMNLKKEREAKLSAKKQQPNMETELQELETEKIETPEQAEPNSAQTEKTESEDGSEKSPDDEAKVEYVKTENDEKRPIKPIESNITNVTYIAKAENREIPGEVDLIKPEDKEKAKKRALLEARELRFPIRKVLELLINVVIIILIGIIRGSSKFKPVVGVTWTCWWDFTWFTIGIVFFLLVAVRNIYLVLKWQKEKLDCDYVFLPQEPVFDRSKIAILLIRSVFAGIIGAIAALGGSMIIGPGLLDLKVPPAFSAATTGVFMIFSMFNTMFNTILNKKLTGQQLAWYIPLAFAFSFISSKIVNWYVKKTGKQSLVMMLVMAAALAGLICLIAVFIKDLVLDTEAQLKFTPVC